MQNPALIVIGAACGLVAGSFAGTAGLRMASGQGIVHGRSHCDGCGKDLSFTCTLPIWSFVSSGGRGACCGAKIDRLHLAGEFAGLCLGVFCAIYAAWPQVLFLAPLGLVLVAVSTVDIRVGRLPDPGVAAVAALCLAIALCGGLQTFVIGVAAAALAFALLELVRRGYRRAAGKGGLGFGDVKLFSALSLWLGLSAPMALFGAAILGLVYAAIARPKRGIIAFGPAIALSAFIVGSTDLYFASRS